MAASIIWYQQLVDAVQEWLDTNDSFIYYMFGETWEDFDRHVDKSWSDNNTNDESSVIIKRQTEATRNMRRIVSIIKANDDV